MLLLQAAPLPGGLAVGELLAHQREHVAGVVLGVDEGVVAADGDEVRAQVDVVEDGRGHRLRGADERGGGARGVGGGGGAGPQRPVVDLGAGREVQRPLRADILGRTGADEAPLEAAALLEGLPDPLRVVVGLAPGGLVGVRDDRAEGDPDAGPVGAARGRRDPVNALDLRADVGERLAPEAEDVALAAAELERGVVSPCGRKPGPKSSNR